MLRLSLIAGFTAAIVALASQSVSAVPLSNGALGAAAGESDLVTNVQFRYCRAVRQECGFRWGWRTWHYFRCVARRGCA
jgi:hypothetical protein